MKNILIIMSFILFSASLPLAAETYSWTDDNGTVNFTENRADIPKKYRKKVKKLDDFSPGESGDKTFIKPILPKTDQQAQEGKVAPDATDVTTKFNGKTYDQWKQELTSRETSMLEVRKNIEALDAQIKKTGITAEVVKERNRMAEKYNELIAEYDKTVEAARKAGLKVEMK